MRLLITLDGSAIGESAAAAVSSWALESKAEVVLMTVVHPDDIHQTPNGEYFHSLTPKGTMSGQLISLADPPVKMAESREQALERARTDGETYLRSVAEQHLKGADAKIHVEFDNDIPEAIVRVAERNEVDFLAIGTHGRTGLRHAILGSVAEAVVRKATVPVLVIGPKARERQAMTPVSEHEAGE